MEVPVFHVNKIEIKKITVVVSKDILNRIKIAKSVIQNAYHVKLLVIIV